MALAFPLVFGWGYPGNYPLGVVCGACVWAICEIWVSSILLCVIIWSTLVPNCVVSLFTWIFWFRNSLFCWVWAEMKFSMIFSRFGLGSTTFIGWFGLWAWKPVGLGGAEFCMGYCFYKKSLGDSSILGCKCLKMGFLGCSLLGLSKAHSTSYIPQVDVLGSHRVRILKLLRLQY